MFSHSISDQSTLLQYEQFLVLGGGISGDAAGHLLLRHGKKVRLADRASTRTESSPFLEIVSDQEVQKALNETQVIIKSPGISPDHPILTEAKKQNLPILSEIYLGRLFFSGLLIGITGTDGKSTTTALTYHLINAKYNNSQVGGNLGLPFTQFCDKQHDIVVLELSSYQLEDSPNLELTSSAILTLAPDHLERHKTMHRYALAKWNIVFHSNPSHTFITQKKVLEMMPIDRIHFVGKTILFGTEETIRIDSKQNVIRTPSGCYDTKKFQLPGFHNLQNLSVAIALAESVGVSEIQIQNQIESFTGLPHRFQPVFISNSKNSKYKNIQFINDSKSTNLHSMLSGIAGYTFKDRLYLILGGEPKDESLTPLIDRLLSLNAYIYIYGKAAEVWKEELNSSKLKNLQFVNNIEEALLAIREKLGFEEFSKVILSPAAASFDQYKNFSERGEHFVSLIERYFGQT